MAATTTTPGPAVQTEIDSNRYPTGRTVTNVEMAPSSSPVTNFAASGLDPPPKDTTIDAVDLFCGGP